MSATPELPDRRTFLLLGAGIGAAGVLSACTVSNPLNSTKTPAASVVGDLAPDVAIAVEAVWLLQHGEEDRVAASAAFPELATPLTALGTLYQAHLAALADAVPDGVDTSPTAPPRPVARTAGAARRTLVHDLGVLHEKLIALAVRAESGPFARLLGTMSAAFSQQAVHLGTDLSR